METLTSPVGLIVILAIVLLVTTSSLIARYKRCPSDKTLAIYGKAGGTSAKCIHGWDALVWLVIQDFAYLDLRLLSIEANLTNALSRQNIRVDVPCRSIIAISTEAENMNAAAGRLLGISPEQIQELVKNILFSQLRLVIATMTIGEINSDRDKFLENISKNVDSELKKVGLKLTNVNVTDIKDESGYIEALGKEAAAKAINEVKISVTEQEKIGKTGKALADRKKDTRIAETHRDRDVKIAIARKDKEISIAEAKKDETVGIAEAERFESIGKAEANRDSRIKISEANAVAIKEENEAKIAIANSEALCREKEAESLRIAISAGKVQQAKALEEAYSAEQKAESARSERERATRVANIIVPAEIDKQRAIIEAQAEAERLREEVKGEVDAIYAKVEAKAKGLLQILTRQAEGYKGVVGTAGGDPTKAFQLLPIEKLSELVKAQVEAAKNIKIDKIIVQDSGRGGDGNNSTANFVSGMVKTVSPLNDLFNMAGLNLPTYLVKDSNVNNKSSEADESTKDEVQKS